MGQTNTMPKLIINIINFWKCCIKQIKFSIFISYMYNFQELIIAKCSYQKPIRFLLLFPSSLLLLLTISERDFNLKNTMNTILIANVSDACSIMAVKFARWLRNLSLNQRKLINTPIEIGEKFQKINFSSNKVELDQENRFIDASTESNVLW